LYRLDILSKNFGFSLNIDTTTVCQETIVVSWYYNDWPMQSL